MTEPDKETFNFVEDFDKYLQAKRVYEASCGMAYTLSKISEPTRTLVCDEAYKLMEWQAFKLNNYADWKLGK